jgi:hypothetical protein
VSFSGTRIREFGGSMRVTSLSWSLTYGQVLVLLGTHSPSWLGCAVANVATKYLGLHGSQPNSHASWVASERGFWASCFPPHARHVANLKSL